MVTVAGVTGGRCVSAERLGSSVEREGQSGSHVDGGATEGPERRKRRRTSFKQHQLRLLNSYFILNHNPDSKDLRQLSLKTGLGKRILQVS